MNQSNTMEWSLRDLKFSCVLRGRLNYDFFISCFGSSEFDADDTSKNSVDERLQVATSNRPFSLGLHRDRQDLDNKLFRALEQVATFVRSLSLHHLTSCTFQCRNETHSRLSVRSTQTCPLHLSAISFITRFLRNISCSCPLIAFQ